MAEAGVGVDRSLACNVVRASMPLAAAVDDATAYHHRSGAQRLAMNHAGWGKDWCCHPKSSWVAVSGAFRTIFVAEDAIPDVCACLSCGCFAHGILQLGPLTHRAAALKVAAMPLLEPATAMLPFHPLLLLLLGMALEPLLGEARGPLARLPHPVRLLGALIAVLDRKLNREERAPADRRLRGALVVVVVVGLAAASGWAISWLGRHLPFAWLLELAAIIALLAQRSLFRHVRAVGAALAERGLEAGRAAVAHIVGRDVRQLDEHAVARAAVESCAENFADAVVAPVFWYVLFGLPGMLAYKAVNTLDSMLGYRNERYQDFGWASARLDDALNIIPARLAGLLLTVAAVAVPGALPGAGLRTMLRDARLHRSPNAGWPEAAVAGALKLSLAGPRRYPGLVVDDPWIGDGTARATARDVARALSLFVAACLLNGGLVAAVATIRLGVT